MARREGQVTLLSAGTTTDGKRVVSGVYRFFETHGLPLDVVLTLLREDNAVPCWLSFHREARTAGMRHERILAKLDEAVCDAYGGAFRDHVVHELERRHAAGELA